MSRNGLILSLGMIVFWLSCVSFADELPMVVHVEAQPLKAQVKRVAQTLQLLGEPLTDEQSAELEMALLETDDAKAVAAIQKVLDPLALAEVNINPESRVKVKRGDAPASLHEQGWRVFLVKVHNEAGVTAALRVSSPNAAPLYVRSSGSPDPKPTIVPADLSDRWLEVAAYDQQPLLTKLSGLELEYRVLSLFSRERGKREAKLEFDVGQGTQDLGFRNELNVLFDCDSAVKVQLDVLDDDGQPTTAQFVFKDSHGRIYPSLTRRLAPDLFFHQQIYRGDHETVLLPPGEYEATYTRGPEYLILKRQITVPQAETHTESFRLKRWIKLANQHWFSGDHHVHAAGCAHYEAPTQGIMPTDMMKHLQGEDLNVGCVLSWGPCWYFQKQFFGGEVHKLSTKDYLMRYDVEVSGFPSSHAGHLCLLGLEEDDYPGTTKIEEWPSWDLPILQWGKRQGAVVGFSHSGWGLKLPSDDLPNYAMSPFDGIGANEYIVDVVHDSCDFISTVDTPAVWELNIWYHTLNCGYTCRISGETDFPCIYGERVGLGRVYVKLAADQPLNYNRWVEGLRDGRSYCCDGLSHLIDFSVNGLGVGEKGAAGKPSLLRIDSGTKISIAARGAALLEEQPREDIRKKSLSDKPYWHVERARLGNSREVPVELIVNGISVAQQKLAADGSLQDIHFDHQLERSSWVALRIFPSSHTNPVFVEVDEKPIRASKRSAQWCLDAVDVCWKQKQARIRDTERPAAKEAYEVARQAYTRILQEAFDDTAQ